jgi:hypothetical protein
VSLRREREREIERGVEAVENFMGSCRGWEKAKK